MKNFERYKPFPTIQKLDRKWPNNILKKAPIWCSVDLRDGNQALEVPMTLEQKLDFFKFLVKIGFKEIEIGFPAASDTEYEFTRKLIDDNLIPDDVVIQVLTQSRKEIIEKTFKALKGAKRAVVHLYNSTSVLQRDVVFNFTKQQTIDLAVFGAKLLKEEEKLYPETEFIYEYSPESFTGTEMDFAADICNAVIDVIKPEKERKIIINLPSTVEMSMPNVYADQIEYMCEHIKNRENVIVSIHPHNDRGTAVAAAELAVLAGADRVEGTLFGNGERTGNADILTIAMNMFSHGIDPCLDFSDINHAIEVYEEYTNMNVAPRHPYAGSLVYTAFSGSHQDAIRKGMERMKEHLDFWEVPYLPIDPVDVGRNYDPIIRINSQSGKGGVAFVLEQNFGLHLPKAFQKDLSKVVTKVSDSSHIELSPLKIHEIFNSEYVNVYSPLKIIYYRENVIADQDVHVSTDIEFNGKKYTVEGEDNGILAAFSHSIEKFLNIKIDIVDYREHSMEYGTKARAISYIQLKSEDGHYYFGAGTSSNISKSSLRAVVSAVNKMIK